MPVSFIDAKKEKTPAKGEAANEHPPEIRMFWTHAQNSCALFFHKQLAIALEHIGTKSRTEVSKQLECLLQIFLCPLKLKNYISIKMVNYKCKMQNL